MAILTINLVLIVRQAVEQSSSRVAADELPLRALLAFMVVPTLRVILMIHC